MANSITVSPITDLKFAFKHLGGFDFAVSIIGKADQLSFPIIECEQILKLEFDDVSAVSTSFKAPSFSDIQKLITFAALWSGRGRLLVHCKAGTSRSPAAAMIALMAIDRTDLVRKVAAARPYFRPNSAMLRIADRFFQTKGMMTSLIDIEASIKRPDIPTAN
jgi:predicted protein tyrosine phosphatase